MVENIKKAKAGDAEAIEEILKDVYQDFYKLAMFRLKNEMDAQDAVQNTNILFYKNIKNLKEEKYFKVWATKILINECNKIYNKRTKTFEEVELDEMKDNIKICSDDYVKAINSKLDTMNILNSLSEKDRDIMYLYINNYKIKEIAKIVDMKENTVKTRIKRSKEYLEKNFKYDKQRGEIMPVHKIAKILITSLAVILIASGLVYAAVIIKNNIQNTKKEETQSVKVERLKINMKADKEQIKENMQLYDENIYTLKISDFQTFKEKEKALLIQFDENDIVINEETFEKHECEVVLVTFFNITKLNLQSVETYTGNTKFTFTFDETNKIKKEQQSYCILISKKYSENKIELEYEKTEASKKPEGAITYKYREFYIENVNEFKNIDLEYDYNQDIYYTKYLDKNEYEKIKEKLGIITNKEISDKDFEGNSAIIIFKKTNQKIKFKKFGIVEENPCIYVEKTQEQYGNGITGLILMLKNNDYSGYNVILNK